VLTYNNNSDMPLAIGVDLGGTQIRTALLQGSRLLSRVGILTGENPTPERIIPRICETINQVIFEADVTPDQVTGIGIGAPGPLNSRNGVVFAPPNLQGWTNVPLRDIIQSHFNKPVFVENDANAAALAEHMFGAGRGSQEMVYMTISTGIGGGIITNGRIVEGIFGTAGEIGHMTIDWHGDRCNCGNIGCLESIASGTAIARRATQMITMGKGSDLLEFTLQHQKMQSGDPVLDKPRMQDTPIRITAHTVARAAEAGIPTACEIIAQAAEGLGVGLINVVHLFNPELIILGGSVTKIGPRLLDPALNILQKRAMRVPRDSVRIVLAELGEDVGLVGAGALIYYNEGKEVRTQELIYQEERRA
jgi:glucokinase